MSDKKEPIRVLQYIGSLEAGGSQSMIMNIYRNIDRSKVQFDFAVDRKGKDNLFYKDEIESLGGKIYIFDEYFKGYNYFAFKKQWKEFFRKHPEYKIIHCHVRSVASIVLKIAKQNGLVTICHSHSTSNGKGIKAVAKKMLQSRIHKYCDYYFACSEESARWLYGENMTKSDKCIILNNAIDTSKYTFDEKVRARARKELGLEDKKVLGQIGRIEKVKNYDFSIELLSRLLKEDDKYFLLIVGAGSLENIIMKKARKLGVDKKMMILKNRSDVPELLQAMDVFIMPSLYEGLPVSLVEAQASGLPCVISNNISDGFLDDECIVIRSLDNIDGWVLSIEEIFSNNGVRKDNKWLIEEAGFDIREVSQRMIAFYQKTAKRKIVFCLGSMGHGGAERVVSVLANYFIENNDVSIVITRPCKIEYKLDERIRHIALDESEKSGGIVRRSVRRIKKLRLFLKKESPDIVIAFLPEPSFRLMMAKTFLPVKTIISVRNDPNKEYNSFIKKLLVRILYVRADGFVFQTPDAKKWFSEKIQKKSVIIPNPVDEKFFRKPYTGEREKKIVSVGRLVKQKNQKMLIDAFSEFRKRHKDYILEIYGDGLLRNKLQIYVDSLDLHESVKLVGEAPNIERKIYKAKMFILTSDYEGMPNALMEAMALGVPCISTDCPIGGPKYLMGSKNGERGILITPGNVHELISAMDVLYNKSMADVVSLNASRSVMKMRTSVICSYWEDVADGLTRKNRQ